MKRGEMQVFRLRHSSTPEPFGKSDVFKQNYQKQNNMLQFEKFWDGKSSSRLIEICKLKHFVPYVRLLESNYFSITVYCWRTDNILMLCLKEIFFCKFFFFVHVCTIRGMHGSARETDHTIPPLVTCSMQSAKCLFRWLLFEHVPTSATSFKSHSSWTNSGKTKCLLRKTIYVSTFHWLC